MNLDPHATVSSKMIIPKQCHWKCCKINFLFTWYWFWSEMKHFAPPPPLSWRLLNTQLLVNYKLNSWMPSTISGVNTIWMFPISCYILGLKIPMLEVVTLLILFQDGMALNTQCFQYALLEFTSTGKSTSHSSLQFIIS